MVTDSLRVLCSLRAVVAAAIWCATCLTSCWGTTGMTAGILGSAAVVSAAAAAAPDMLRVVMPARRPFTSCVALGVVSGTCVLRKLVFV